MVKRIPMILLLFFPYLYILVAMFFINNYESNIVNLFLKLIIAFCCLVIVVFIPNMIYAFLIAEKVKSSLVLLFWNMLLKLCNIPIYIALFSVGVSYLMVPPGILVVFFLAVFDYTLLLTTSMYGVSGLLLARREGKIATATTIVNIILHFFFCIDVISAIVIFCKVKAKGKM